MPCAYSDYPSAQPPCCETYAGGTPTARAARQQKTLANPKAARAVADGKAPLDYLEPCALVAESRVMRNGAYKYGRRNYRDTEMLITTYVGAIMRHTLEWASGLDADKDDGEHPLAHIRACCAVVMGAMEAGNLRDDRHEAASTPASDAVHIDGNQDAKAGVPAPEPARAVYTRATRCGQYTYVC